MGFAARKVKKGLFEVEGIEAFIEKKLHELKQSLGLAPKPQAPVAKVATAGGAKKKAAKKVSAPKAASPASADAVVGRLASALSAHPRGKALANAGKQKDQLLRSLIPLYLVRGAPVEVSSGATSKFWAAHGVKFAAPNAAKALREHKGYARRGKTGLAITSEGSAYVEAALVEQKQR